MITLAVWWSAMLLEALILVRGSRSQLFKRHPFFYVYLADVLFCDASLYILRLFSPASYDMWAWHAGFLNMILAFGISLEIVRYLLSSHPPAHRFATTARSSVGGLAACCGGMCVFRVNSSEEIKIDLLRDVAAIQGILLVSLIGAIFYYGAPIESGLKGIILGYGLCLGASVVILTLRSYIGAAFDNVWDIAQPLSYTMALGVWLVTLWKYHPNSTLRSYVRAETVRETLVRGTKYKMGEMLTYFARTARS